MLSNWMNAILHQLNTNWPFCKLPPKHKEYRQSNSNIWRWIFYNPCFNCLFDAWIDHQLLQTENINKSKHANISHYSAVYHWLTICCIMYQYHTAACYSRSIVMQIQTTEKKIFLTFVLFTYNICTASPLSILHYIVL